MNIWFICVLCSMCYWGLYHYIVWSQNSLLYEPVPIRAVSCLNVTILYNITFQVRLCFNCFNLYLLFEVKALLPTLAGFTPLYFLPLQAVCCVYLDTVLFSYHNFDFFINTAYQGLGVAGCRCCCFLWISCSSLSCGPGYLCTCCSHIFLTSVSLGGPLHILF